MCLPPRQEGYKYPASIPPETYATSPRNRTQATTPSPLSLHERMPYSRDDNDSTRTSSFNGLTRTHPRMLERRERFRIRHTPIVPFIPVGIDDNRSHTGFWQ